MTSRTLLNCVLEKPLVRRNRRDDGRVFGVATARDTDRGEPRTWTIFVNDPDLIEKFEALKTGEPVAIAGAFNIGLNGSRILYRITADAFVGARKQRKKRGAKEVDPVDDPDDPPPDQEAPGAQSTQAGPDPRTNAAVPFNDALPF